MNYTSGNGVEGLEPAQVAATANTGDLLSDTFKLTTDYTASVYITVWTLDRDGSTPVTLVSATEFNLDEAGTYLITGQMSIALSNTVGNTSHIFKIDLQAKPSGGSWASTGQIILVGGNHSTIVSSEETKSMSWVYNAALDDRLRFQVTKTNCTGNVDSSLTSLDILQLKQVTD